LAHGRSRAQGKKLTVALRATREDSDKKIPRPRLVKGMVWAVFWRNAFVEKRSTSFLCAFPLSYKEKALWQKRHSATQIETY
jgi:hypothetical protein